MRISLVAVALLGAATAATAPAAAAAQDAVSMSLPDSVPDSVFSGSRSREVTIAQVLLDRSRFSPGVVDGYMGGNTRRAILAFQRANKMKTSGEVSQELLKKLMVKNSGSVVQIYTISEGDVNGPFVEVPSSMTAKAKLENLAYENSQELLAEKFHMDIEFLRALNPDADFDKEGTKIAVISPRDEQIESRVTRIEVDKEDNSVRAYKQDGTLLARYPATVGSSAFPSPSGTMEVLAVAPEPKYYFEPAGRKWGPDKQLTISAGPNNPIGGTWIDLSKEGYGIHGSPDPKLIGKTASHGCVRLTNWDAEELGGSVSKGVTVEFL